MKHLSKIGSLALVALFAAACAARTPTPIAEPVTDPSLWAGDPALYRLLSTYPIGAAQRDSINAYLTAHDVNKIQLLAEAAVDQNAPSAVRANALLTLAQQKATSHLAVFRAALSDDDARVRATAVAAMREFIDVRREESLRIARAALEDTDPTVQVQALQMIGERDIGLLRSFVRRGPHAELRVVATDLIRVAEERGVPLDMDSTTGVLRRETPHGYTVTFTPTRRWPQWQAAVGAVSIQRDRKQVVQLDGIEAVAGVVPVFFSSTGSHIVFERDRQIIVRTVSSGAERVVGPGIAPRPRPFTGDFVYLRETPQGRTEMRHMTRIGYEVVRAPFEPTDPTASGESEVIGTTNATTSLDNRGNYSPARWLRIEEVSGKFFLTADGLERFDLPDPFGTAVQGG